MSGGAGGADAALAAERDGAAPGCAGEPMRRDGGAAGSGAPDAQEPPFVRNAADKHARARFTLGRAFASAGSGFAFALRTQRNMKIHVAAAVAAVAAGMALGIDGAAWACIALCIAAVFAAECLNTAVEAVVDLVSPEYAELARRAKDCAAGAVLVCAAGAVCVAAAVFLPRLAALAAG